MPGSQRPTPQPPSDDPLDRLLAEDITRKSKTKKERFTIRRVAVALRAAGGIYSGAAALLKCQPNTVKKYVERHTALQKLLVEVQDEVLDLAETKLIEAVRNGDQKAVQFLLRCKGKGRGYVEKHEVTGRDGGPIAIADLRALSDEELRRLAAGDSSTAGSR